MSAPDSWPEDVDFLASRLVDGGLSSTEHAQLLARLEQSQEALDQYIDHALLHAILRKELGGFRPTTLDESLFPAAPVGGESTGDCELRSSVKLWRPYASRSNAQDVTSARARNSSRRRLFAAAAMLLLLATVGAVYWQITPWHPGDEFVAASRLSGVKSVQLESGTLRLTLDQVGDVVLEGPADFDLLGPRRARLNKGRIRVRITHASGRGFVVETPDGKVTDLGTEFGVDVGAGSSTGVVVFEGAVDLAVQVRKPSAGVHVERLLQGEGLTIDRGGQLERIMSVVTGQVATFQTRGEAQQGLTSPVIVDVADTIRAPDLKNFYEIVPGGLGEDVLAYVDRPEHDWNGIDSQGMPAYLRGADYVKPFNSDKMRHDVEIAVVLSCPAKLFVFFDDRVESPEWLKRNFRDTGDDIGLDVGQYVLNGVKYFRLERAAGPGNSLDATFSVWEQVVNRPGVVQLGPNSGGSELTAMYSIAAIRWDPDLNE